MKFAHTRIAVAGTHSTGKSTFLTELARRLEGEGFRVGRVADVASKAHDLGFPILRDHVYESTLWIIAEGIRQEMEEALRSDVVLVDRPVLDAVGYLLAALDATDRTEPRLPELEVIATAHTPYYDWVGVTVLDEAAPLGPDRDLDLSFRVGAAKRIEELAGRFAPGAVRLERGREKEIQDQAINFVLSRR